MTNRARTTVAGLDLKNPVMAGSGEATMTLAGIVAAIDAGAAAVVAKSSNDSALARKQLEVAEYVLLDEQWRQLEWGAAPRGASLFCRSGLAPASFDDWMVTLAEADLHAKKAGSYVVASIIVSDAATAPVLAQTVEQSGLRWLELNLGPPYRGETPRGAIRSAVEAREVHRLVHGVRTAVTIPLTVKISSQGDPLAMAEAAIEAGADAICLTGRYPAFLPDLETRRPIMGTFGAIGGYWSLPLSLRWVAKARQRLGSNVSIIGTNGARDGSDVLRFVLSGASAVQLTTAVFTDGPHVLDTARHDVDDYLHRHQVELQDIVGEAADHARSIADLVGEVADGVDGEPPRDAG